MKTVKPLIIVTLLSIFLYSCGAVSIKEDKFTGEKIFRTNHVPIYINFVKGNSLYLDVIKTEKENQNPMYFLEATHVISSKGLFGPSFAKQLNIKPGESLIFIADNKKYSFSTEREGSKGSIGTDPSYRGNEEIARYNVDDPNVLLDIFNADNIEFKLIGYNDAIENNLNNKKGKLQEFVNKYCIGQAEKKVKMAATKKQEIKKTTN